MNADVSYLMRCAPSILEIPVCIFKLGLLGLKWSIFSFIPTEAWKCNFQPFWEIMTDQPTIQQDGHEVFIISLILIGSKESCTSNNAYNPI